MTGKKKTPGFGSAAGLTLGLAALAEVTQSAQARTLTLGQIQVQPGHNPRGQFDAQAFAPERLDALAASIRREGVLQPVWVRDTGSGPYVLIAGERRLRAAGLAGLSELPALIFRADEERATLLALIENGQREDLHLLDETLAGFRALEARTGLPREELLAYLNQVRKGRTPDVHGAEALLREVFGTGLSVWVQFRAKVFDLTPGEREAVWNRDLDFSVAVALTRLPPGEARDRLRAQAQAQGLNAAQVRALAAAEGGSAPPSALQGQVATLKKGLPKLARLEGKRAREAARLIEQLNALLDQA